MFFFFNHLVNYQNPRRCNGHIVVQCQKTDSWQEILKTKIVKLKNCNPFNGFECYQHVYLLSIMSVQMSLLSDLDNMIMFYSNKNNNNKNFTIKPMHFLLSSVVSGSDLTLTPHLLMPSNKKEGDYVWSLSFQRFLRDYERLIYVVSREENPF